MPRISSKTKVSRRCFALVATLRQVCGYKGIFAEPSSIRKLSKSLPQSLGANPIVELDDEEITSEEKSRASEKAGRYFALALNYVIAPA